MRPDRKNSHEKEDTMKDTPSLREAEIAAGLYSRKNAKSRVRWVNALHRIVARRCPTNAAGSKVVSDVDLLLASEDERMEALDCLLEGLK